MFSISSKSFSFFVYFFLEKLHMRSGFRSLNHFCINVEEKKLDLKTRKVIWISFQPVGSHYLFRIFCKFSNQDQSLAYHSKTIENNVIKLYIFWKLNKMSNKIWKKLKCYHGDWWFFSKFRNFRNGSKSCEKYQNINFQLNYLDQIQPYRWEMNYFA